MWQLSDLESGPCPGLPLALLCPFREEGPSWGCVTTVTGAMLAPGTSHGPCKGCWLWGRWRGRPNGINTQHCLLTLQRGLLATPLPHLPQALAGPSALELNTRMCQQQESLNGNVPGVLFHVPGILISYQNVSIL